MYLKFLKVFASFNKILGYISGSLVLASAFVMLYDVVMRYFFGAPSIRAPFIAAFLMLGAIFIGTAYALQSGGHVRVEMLAEKLKPTPRKLVLSVGYSFALIFIYVLTRQLFNATISAYANDWRAVGHLPLPMVYLYGIMTFGLLMMIIGLGIAFVNIWYKKEDTK